MVSVSLRCDLVARSIDPMVHAVFDDIFCADLCVKAAELFRRCCFLVCVACFLLALFCALKKVGREKMAKIAWRFRNPGLADVSPWKLYELGESVPLASC